MKEEIKKIILENYKEKSTREIGKMCNVSCSTISYYAKRMNLLLTKNKFNVDEKLYKNINDKRFVYFLGYLWADGYLSYYKNGLSHSVRIETVENDSNHILNIIKDLPIKYSLHNRVRKNRQPQQNIMINDAAFSQFLVSELCFDRKGYICHSKILEKIPQDLWVYWIQGYMDGDGTIRAYPCKKTGRLNRGVIEFSSSYNQDWEFLKNIIEGLGCGTRIIKYVSKKGNKSSKLYIGCMEDCLTFLNWLFKNSDLCLERKYKDYEKYYKEWVPKRLKNIGNPSQ